MLKRILVLSFGLAALSGCGKDGLASKALGKVGGSQTPAVVAAKAQAADNITSCFATTDANGKTIEPDATKTSKYNCAADGNEFEMQIMPCSDLSGRSRVQFIYSVKDTVKSENPEDEAKKETIQYQFMGAVKPGKNPGEFEGDLRVNGLDSQNTLQAKPLDGGKFSYVILDNRLLGDSSKPQIVFDEKGRASWADFGWQTSESVGESCQTLSYIKQPLNIQCDLAGTEAKKDDTKKEDAPKAETSAVEVAKPAPVEAPKVEAPKAEPAAPAPVVQKVEATKSAQDVDVVVTASKPAPTIQSQKAIVTLAPAKSAAKVEDSEIDQPAQVEDIAQPAAKATAVAATAKPAAKSSAKKAASKKTSKKKQPVKPQPVKQESTQDSQ